MTGSANPDGGDYVVDMPSREPTQRWMLVPTDVVGNTARTLAADLVAMEARARRAEAELAEVKAQLDRAIGDENDWREMHADRKAKRDSARGIAVALEQECARVKEERDEARAEAKTQTRIAENCERYADQWYVTARQATDGWSAARERLANLRRRALAYAESPTTQRLDALCRVAQETYTAEPEVAGEDFVATYLNLNLITTETGTKSGL